MTVNSRKRNWSCNFKRTLFLGNQDFYFDKQLFKDQRQEFFLTKNVLDDISNRSADNFEEY